MIVFIRQTKSLHIKVIFYILSRVAVLRSTNQYRACTESIDSSRIDDDGLMYGWMQECITALSCRQKEANVTFVYVCHVVTRRTTPWVPAGVFLLSGNVYGDRLEDSTVSMVRIESPH